MSPPVITVFGTHAAGGIPFVVIVLLRSAVLDFVRPPSFESVNE